MCDAKGACAATSKTFSVLIEPLASQIQRWTNYIKTGGASGEWKYNESTQEMYSTKNVGWTGFWNPSDVGLKNYIISYKMGVVPTNDDDALGMTFRMKDLNNFYLLSIDQRGSNGGVGGYHSGLYKFTNGSKKTLVDLSQIKWVGNTFDSYKIEVDGKRIKIWHKGDLVVDYVDNTSPHLTGGWGPFTISQANARFKDIDFSIIE